jgi:aminopeptidase N
VNKGEGSFIRVRYDKETLVRLKGEIISGQLSTHDRLGIIRDLFALAEGGYIDTSEALEFSLSYKDENEYIIWAEIASGVNKIHNLIRDEPFEKIYNKYALSLFTPLAEKMGFKSKLGENHSQVFLRSLALSQAAHYGNKKRIKEAKEIFTDRERNPIPSDIRGVVYSIVASNGNQEDWKMFENLYKRESLQEEKDRYGRAMTAFKNEKLLSKTLAYALSKDIRMQDAPHMIVGVWQNSHGRDLTWKFIKNNWKIISKKFGEGGHFLSRLLSPLGSHIKMKDLQDAKKFFSKNPAPGADRTLEQAYERIASNSAWLKADKNNIKKWLMKNF